MGKLEPELSGGVAQGMTQYRVSWTIDVEAATPVQAAREAQRMVRSPRTLATVYEVSDGTEITVVDLLQA